MAWTPAPKPEPRVKAKSRTWVSLKSRARKATESAIIAQVRPVVMRRDDPCRAAKWGLGPCGGPAQWAHIGPWRRYLTRGRPPEERHCVQGSARLCDKHHDMYDANAFALESIDGDLWAAGRLRIVSGIIILHEEKTKPSVI